MACPLAPLADGFVHYGDRSVLLINNSYIIDISNYRILVLALAAWSDGGVLILTRSLATPMWARSPLGPLSLACLRSSLRHDADDEVVCTFYSERDKEISARYWRTYTWDEVRSHVLLAEATWSNLRRRQFSERPHTREKRAKNNWKSIDFGCHLKQVKNGVRFLKWKIRREKNGVLQVLNCLCMIFNPAYLGLLIFRCFFGFFLSEWRERPRTFSCIIYLSFIWWSQRQRPLQALADISRPHFHHKMFSFIHVYIYWSNKHPHPH